MISGLHFTMPGDEAGESIAADAWWRRGWLRLGLYDSARWAAMEGFGTDDAVTVGAITAAVGREVIHQRFRELWDACRTSDCVIVPDAADDADVEFLRSLGAKVLV